MASHGRNFIDPNAIVPRSAAPTRPNQRGNRWHDQRPPPIHLAIPPRWQMPPTPLHPSMPFAPPSAPPPPLQPPNVPVTVRVGGRLSTVVPPGAEWQRPPAPFPHAPQSQSQPQSLAPHFHHPLHREPHFLATPLSVGPLRSPYPPAYIGPPPPPPLHEFRPEPHEWHTWDAASTPTESDSEFDSFQLMLEGLEDRDDASQMRIDSPVDDPRSEMTRRRDALRRRRDNESPERVRSALLDLWRVLHLHTRHSRRTVEEGRLRQLPQIAFKAPAAAERCGEQDDKFMCAICQLDFEAGDKLLILPCLHRYHTDCIVPWATKERGECPTCRHPVLELGGDDFITKGSD